MELRSEKGQSASSVPAIPGLSLELPIRTASKITWQSCDSNVLLSDLGEVILPRSGSVSSLDILILTHLELCIAHSEGSRHVHFWRCPYPYSELQ